MNILEDLLSDVTDKASESAKNSAINTLNDPQFRKAINDFTTNFILEHKVVIIGTFGLLLAFTVMASINVVSNYQSNRRR